MLVLNAIKEFEAALLDINQEKAENILQAEVADSGILNVIDNIIVKALEKIGRDWQDGNIALSQIYMSGIICEKIVDKILPNKTSQSDKKTLDIAIAVLNDYHILGKRIVYSVLRGSGINLIDFGTLNAQQIVKRTCSSKIKILLISTLMLPSALEIKKVTQSLASKKANTKVIVGGAPFIFDPKLWKSVGADAMGKSASDAIAIVKKMQKELK